MLQLLKSNHGTTYFRATVKNSTRNRMTGTSRVLFNLYTSIQSHRGRQESLIDLGCALSYLTKDLKKAYQNEGEGCSFKVLEPKRLIFQIQGKDYGWLIKKNRLMRYQGRYNKITNSWQHLSVSMIASITGGSFSYRRTGLLLEGIRCTLSSKNNLLRTFIATRGCDE